MFYPSYMHIGIDNESAEIKSNVFRYLGADDSYPLDNAWINNAIILLLKYPDILDAKEYSIILYQYSYRTDRQARYMQDNFLSTWQNAAHVSDFGHQALANSLAAFGKLQVKPNNSFLRNWYEQAEKILFEPVMQDEMFISLELANILTAFERLEMLPASYFLGAWFYHAEQIIDSFNAQALANSLMACGKLRIPLHPMFLAAWYKRAIEEIGKFNNFELSGIIIAFERLRMQPESVFFELWQQQVIRRIVNFKPQELVSSLQALKELSMQPDLTFLKAWSCQAEASVRSFSFTNLQESIRIGKYFNQRTSFLKQELDRRAPKRVTKRKYDHADAEKPKEDNKKQTIEQSVNEETPKITLATQSFYAGNQVSHESACKPKLY